MRKFLLTLLLCLLPALAHATVCPTGYATTLNLVVPAQTTMAADLTDFPVYFAGSSSFVGTVQSSSGLDVVFCDAASGGNKLSWELVPGTYNASTGAGEWYVKFPTISKTVSKTVYVMFGKSEASDLSNAADVWSNGYLAVWHFGSPGTLSLNDSLGNYNLTNTNVTSSTGKIGGAGTFGGNANATNSSAGLAVASGTYETWIRPIVLGSGNHDQFGGNANWTNYTGYELRQYGSNVDFYVVMPSNGYYLLRSNTGTPLQVGVWASFAGTWTGSTPTVQLFINGSSASTSVYSSASGPVGTIGAYPFMLGNGHDGSSGPANAYLDEVRVSSVVRSADWLKSTYTNQYNPTSFYQFGGPPSFVSQPTVAWTSPSSITASFSTSVNSSVVGACGTVTGGPYTSAVTPSLYTQGWQRTDFTGTSSNWGHAVAITGLHQNTPYFCVITATTPFGSLTSNEFSATTGALATTPVTVNAVSRLTRLNDQVNGANGMPNNGFWYIGDTEMTTFAADGNFYGISHDCTGVGGAYASVICLSKWNASHTTATQVSPAGGWTNTTWFPAYPETWGIQAIRGNIYVPVQQCWSVNPPLACGFWGMFRTPDYFAHSITAGNQAAQGPLGPGYSLATGIDTSSIQAILPNNPILGNGSNVQGFTGMYGPIQSCQDESINCVPQANNDGWIYSWGTYGQTNSWIILARTRVEDMPLMDASKWQVYVCPSNGDDGLYDACWSTNPALATPFGSYGGAYNGWSLGMLPNSQFIPDFNRFVFLNTVDNTSGGSVVLYDSGPYPWGKQTAIGSVSWDNDVLHCFQPAFGQILPGSYLRTGISPLSALLKLTMTGTVSSCWTGTSGVTNSTTGSSADSSYSPFTANLSLIGASTVPVRPQVSAVNRTDAHILSGLDLFYDFRGQTNLSANVLPNLSPNDPLGQYTATNFSNITTGMGGIPAALYSAKGQFQYGYFGRGTVTTTPYNKTLSAFTALVVWEEYYVQNGSGYNYETIFADGTLKLQRNGTALNSWIVTLGSTTIGPFTLPTDQYGTPQPTPWVAVVVKYDGTALSVYSSSQIPRSGYTLPLTKLASATVSATVSGTLYLGAQDGSVTNPFHGTLSNLLIYSRALSDSELIHEMDALRTDMQSRGVALP